MSIIGHGIDLVEISRVARLRAEHGARFLDRCFTAREQAYCFAQREPDMRFAGRFAAKEAILKVLGTGWRGQIAWTDMEILNDAAGIISWHVSISHTDTLAMGSAIGEGESPAK